MNTIQTNELSYLRVMEMRRVNNGQALAWPCATDRVYDVEFNTNLPRNGWAPVPGMTNLGCADGWMNLTNSLSPEALKMDRLRVRSPE